MERYGAEIERGEIIEIQDDSYRVSSLSRNGIVTPLLKGIGNEKYALNQKVYFFIFDDGKGRILAALD